MHARELVEMAAIVAARGPAVISGPGQLSPTGAQQYWAASKCRFDRWGRSLRTCADAAAKGRRSRPARQMAQAVIEEILTSEVLTRVWTAVTVACDQQRGTSEMEPITRSILVGHLEVRNRALALAMTPQALDDTTVSELNTVRRRTERWTDLLIGQLTCEHDVSEFAIDPARAKEFADDLKHEQRSGAGQQAWSMTMASLRVCFQSGLSPLSPNGDLNTAIAGTILASFPAGLFDSTGVFRSLWLTRMLYTTDDAQGLLDDLIRATDAEVRVAARPAFLSENWPRR